MKIELGSSTAKTAVERVSRWISRTYSTTRDRKPGFLYLACYSKLWINERLHEMKKAIITALLVLPLIAAPAQEIDDFSLKSVTNNVSFTLSESRGEYVALHFLLKTECPVCLRFTMEYFNNQDLLPGVKNVFIKPDSEEEIIEWAGHLQTDELDQLPIFRDPGATLAKKLEIPDGYAFHNQIVHYPALILIDPEGKEVFRYVGKNNGDRFSFEQLKEKLADLKE